MSDISDDEVIEKPKRVMSEAQKQALKKGRELARMNRMKSEPVETVVSIAEEPKKEKKPRKKAEVKEEVKVEVKAEPIAETKPEPKKRTRKPKEVVREPSPVRQPSPEPAPQTVKKERKPRTKKVVPTETIPQPQTLVKPVAIKPSMVFV